MMSLLVVRPLFLYQRKKGGHGVCVALRLHGASVVARLFVPLAANEKD